MTIIAAAVDSANGCVWMGADTMFTDDEYESRTQNELVYPKIIKVGDVLVGIAGQHFYHTLLRCHQPPAPHPDQDTALWVQQTLFPWIEEKVQEMKPSKKGMSMIAARGGELFQAEVKNVDVIPQKVSAIGTGSSYALGALHSLEHVTVLSAQDRVRAAVAAACYHDPYCGGRIDVMSTRGSWL